MLKRLPAEALGTTLLLATVVGSGIMAERLAGGNVAIAHAMSDLPLLGVSQHIRTGIPRRTAEFFATFGLLAVIFGVSRQNPAATLARSFNNTFSGIRPFDVPGFVAAQLAGAVAETYLFARLVPCKKP